MKKGKAFRLVLILLVAGAGISAWLYRARANAARERDVLRLYGNVDIRQVRLAFFCPGRIEQILAEEGDRVEAGQSLARLDAMRYQEALNRAEAQFSAQQNVLARMKAGNRPEDIAEARARVQSAEAALADARQKHRRLADLAQGDFVSKQKLEEAEIAIRIAEASAEATRQAAIRIEQGPRTEDIAAAEAQLRALEAARELAKRDLADTVLTAPAAGIIQNRILEAGDMASAQTPVFTLALNNPIWVRAYVPEPELGKIAAGMSATVRTDSFPDKKYEGQVGFISPTAEFTPKQVETSDLRTRLVYEVRIQVRNPDHELRLGMPATVWIPLSPTPVTAQEP